MGTESLRTLLQRIDDKRIVLPQFQRDFVWPTSAVIKLMSSIFNGYPIGALLLMESDGKYDFRPIEEAPDFDDQYSVDDFDGDLVLDGQQRLTASYRTLYGASFQDEKKGGRYYFKYQEFVTRALRDEIPEGSQLEDFFEYKRASYVSKRLSTTVDEQSFGLFPLDIILREPRGASYSDWLGTYNFSKAAGDQRQYEELSKISSQFIANYIEKVTGYQVNYERIVRDTNPDVICTIFETINTTGIKLTVFDLLVAKCFKSNFRLRDRLEEALEITPYLSALDPQGQQVAVVQIPRILGLFIKKECKKGILLSLPPEEIESYWDSAIAALNKACHLLCRRFGCFNADFIPTMDIVSALAMIVADKRFSLERHGDRLDQWYWSCVFGSYFSGAPESKIARTVREWKEPGGWLDDGHHEPTAVANFAFRPSLMDLAQKNSVIYKGLITLMLSRSPFDIGPDRVGLSFDKRAELNDHHIFPLSFLKNYGIKGYPANQIANRMPMLQETNLRISADAPQKYLADRAITHPDALSEMEHFYFCDANLLRNPVSEGNFMRFCEDRKDRFQRAILQAVNKEEAAVENEQLG